MSRTNMDVNYSRQFKKQYKKLPQEIKNKFKERLVLFLKDQSNRQLSVHKLSGKLDDLWSINITGDIRAIIDRSFDGVALFVAIGSHSELYE